MALFAGLIAAAKATGQSGVPTVKVFVTKGAKSSAKFSAELTYVDDAGKDSTATIGDNAGRVKSYTKLDDLLRDVVEIAPALTMLTAAQSFSLVIDNPEVLAARPSTTIENVASLTKKLLRVRELKANTLMTSQIRGIELTGNAALANGTPEQQAKYAELVLRKKVIDHIADVYGEQDAALVALIVAMGGTPPGA